uniref:LRRCT domain-containing protein n=1 Tax=Trichuris muris TaxID=70415 RepID=A0A5S6QGM8_TRIMR
MKNKKQQTNLLLFISALFVHCLARCPNSIRLPCICRSTRYEPVSITCDRVADIHLACQALGALNIVIDSLTISNSPIQRLPTQALAGYRITRLVLRNNNLTDVDVDAFNGMPITTLTELEIRNNLLTSVPQTGVSKLQRLNSLVLANNNIRILPAASFAIYQSRSWITKLDLSANRMERIDDDAFLGLDSVRELNLDKNNLLHVPTEALQRLLALEDLSLAANQISSVPVHALNFPQLKSISLEVNRISSIEANAFAGIPNLLYLYLSSNRFERLDQSMLRSVRRLKVLAMGNNPIGHLSVGSFRFVQELVRLEMPNCLIRSVEQGTFQTIPKVQVIVLSRNQLRRITRHMFKELGELYSLDLKGNKAAEIDDRAFAVLPSLRHLDLSDNLISTLPRNTFDGTFQSGSNRVLYLYENPWNCDPLLDWLRQWLRDNREIIIDAPGNPPAVCKGPGPLLGWPIRTLNPELPIIPGPESGALKPVTESTTHNKARMHLAAMILGIILGIFMITLLLLLIVRYFASQKRRKDKEAMEDQRRLGSTIAGSVFPSPAVPMSTLHSRRNHSYQLGRPWYWWF